MPPRAKPRNPMFSAVVVMSALFIITILALVARILSDPRAPLGRWLDRHGGTLIAVEVVGILTTGFLALAIDRRQTPPSAGPKTNVGPPDETAQKPPIGPPGV